MRILLTIVLTMVGCCPHQQVEIVGSSKANTVDVYDPNDNTWYTFSTVDGHVIRKSPHWNKY